MLYANFPLNTRSYEAQHLNSENGGFNEFLVKTFCSQNWLPSNITDTDVTQFIDLLNKHEYGISELEFQCHETGGVTNGSSIDDVTNGWILVKNTNNEADNSKDSNENTSLEDSNGESINNGFTVIEHHIIRLSV